MKKAILFFLLFFNIYSEEFKEKDIFNIIGFSIDQLIKKYGSPYEVFPLREDDAWMDNVVFYYNKSNKYFFLFQNRVWQLRFDYRSKDIILGYKINQEKKSILSIINKNEINLLHSKDEIVYDLPYQKVPIRVRLIFKDDKLDDIYIYRSDF